MWEKKFITLMILALLFMSFIIYADETKPAAPNEVKPEQSTKTQNKNEINDKDKENLCNTLSSIDEVTKSAGKPPAPCNNQRVTPVPPTEQTETYKKENTPDLNLTFNNQDENFLISLDINNLSTTTVTKTKKGEVKTQSKLKAMDAINVFLTSEGKFTDQTGMRKFDLIAAGKPLCTINLKDKNSEGKEFTSRKEAMAFINSKNNLDLKLNSVSISPSRNEITFNSETNSTDNLSYIKCYNFEADKEYLKNSSQIDSINSELQKLNFMEMKEEDYYKAKSDILARSKKIEEEIKKTFFDDMKLFLNKALCNSYSIKNKKDDKIIDVLSGSACVKEQ